MSDTPETDEIALHPATTDWVWREHSRKLERERDAYKRAKQENDERFMLERDEARRERDEARAERDEWIARFRADKQLIKEAMIPYPENPEA